ncbi:MAG: PAS domain-containing protein, partial [Desulfocucumaceae bacterium]
MSIDLLEKAFNYLPLPVFIIQDGFFRYVNPSMAEITGYTAEQLVSIPCEKLLYPDDIEKVERNKVLRLEGEAVPATYQFRTVDRKGKIFYLRGFFSRIEYKGHPATLGQIIDTTRPKMIMDELNLQRAYFRDLFENFQQGVALLDENDCFTDVNRGFEKIFGFSHEEINGLPVISLVVPEDYQSETAEIFKAVHAGGSVHRETVRKRKDGSLVHVSILAYPINYKGSRLGAFAMYTDITERKLTEEKVRESEAKYRLVFENAPLGILHFDNSGIIKAVNNTLVKIIGSTEEALVGINMAGLPNRGIVNALNKALSGILGRFEGEYQSVTATKATPVKVDFAPIVIGGKVVGGVGIVEDITDRKRAQDEIYREKERLSVTLASIGDAVIVVDRESRITMINPVAQTLTGWKEEEAVGSHLDEVFSIINEYTGEPVNNPVQKVIAGGSIVGLANHTAVIARDGTRRAIADSAAPIRDAAGEMLGVILVFRDMKEQREKEEALKRSEERFRNLVESTDDWVWEVDTEGIFTYVSPQIRDMLGFMPWEVVGKTIFKLLSKSEARRVGLVFSAYASE